jgi:hypothetical protein
LKTKKTTILNYLIKYFGLFLVIFSVFTFKAKAQEETAIALYVYNFTRYIEYPASDASSDFVIDVIAHKSVYDKLKELTAGKMVGRRNIVVRFLESVNKVSQSQILFVGFWQSPALPKILDMVGNTSTLIIAEKDGMIDAGAGINFVVRNNGIKFEVKRANIEKRGLSLSKELENMAYKSY